MSPGFGSEQAKSEPVCIRSAAVDLSQFVERVYFLRVKPNSGCRQQSDGSTDVPHPLTTELWPSLNSGARVPVGLTATPGHHQHAHIGFATSREFELLLDAYPAHPHQRWGGSRTLGGAGR